MRARDYSYRLGRLMQTDPIGYGDGLNFYNFAQGDPVNGADPSGLTTNGGLLHQAQNGSASVDDASSPTSATPSDTPPSAPSVDELRVTGQKQIELAVAPSRPIGDTSANNALGSGAGQEDRGDGQKQQNDTAPKCKNGGSTKRMLVTGYDNGHESTGKNPGDKGYGLTTDGSTAGPGTVVAPRSYKFGTEMYVPDYGMATVHDRGGAIKNAHIDLWFSSLKAARKWGSQHKDVQVFK